MPQSLAIASCRVSSDEQLKNNSLNKQKDSVLKAAEKLGVEIPKEYWWSGSVSSKRGKNVERKDLQEMLLACKRDKKIKYLIVDEPDRFMRSIQEAMHYEVEFEKHGVKVWYASDDELNSDNMSARFMKIMKYFSAEGSNEERQRKSISGQLMALREGRFPYHPPIGYKKGPTAAVHVVDPVTGPIIKHILTNVAEGNITPSEGVKYFNDRL